MKRIHKPDGRTPSLFNRLQFSNEGLIWFAVTLGIGFLGWLKSINVVFLLSYFMLFLLLLNALAARTNARRVGVVRQPSPPVHAGEEATVRFDASNASASPATVVVEDKVGERSRFWLLLGLTSGKSTSFYSRWSFPARGRFPSVLRVSSGYPLGLISFHRTLQVGETIVLPAVGAIDPEGFRRWVSIQAGESDRRKKVLRRVTAEAADVRGVRPYREGDPIRAIHWRSSARRGELMVREYDNSPAPDLILVVEPWLPTEPTAQQRFDLEAALSLAATVAANWIRVSATPATIVMAGDSEPIRAATSTDRGIREALIPFAGTPGGSAFEPLDRNAFDRSLLRSARILVSSRANSPYGPALRQSLGRAFATVSPHDSLPWYQPPLAAKKSEIGTASDAATIA